MNVLSGSTTLAASASTFGIFGSLAPPLALGLLRLSTEGRPTEEESIHLIHSALNAGIRLIDTADVYCLDHKDLHYGERLARKAIATWNGPTNEVRILTKAGMMRPQGKWLPHGKPEHLRKAVEGSLEALGTDRLFLLQLHVHDPKVPFEETLSALAELQQQGKVEHLGLCNTSIAEIEQAQRHFPVAAVQNELSLQVRKSASEGLLDYTLQRGIPFLAYRPLGGIAKVEKLASNKNLLPLAKRHFVTPIQLALAAVRATGNNVVPLVGATRVASVQSSCLAMNLQLDASDRAALEVKYSFKPKNPAMIIPEISISSGTPGDGEIVLVMGIQGAGKSERVGSYVERGYARLNRDILGGKLDDLIPRMHQLIQNGQRRMVLDNTYPTRISRALVAMTARSYGIRAVCQFLNTPLHEARINVVLRMLARYGRPLGPDEMKVYSKTDPNLPPPAALKKWQDGFEHPHLDEGFSQVEVIPFSRRLDPANQHKALLLDVDGTLRRTKSGEIYPRHPDDVELLPGRQAVLKRYVEEGYQLFFISNQSGVASGKVTQAAVEASLLRTAELLQLPIREISYCPHPAFPVGCYCRKPFPGMGVYLMHKHQLNPNEIIVVGDMKSDEEFAKGLGLRYMDGAMFFS